MSLPVAREVVRPNQPNKTRNELGLMTLSDATDKIRHQSGAMDPTHSMVVLFEPSTNLPSMYKPVLNDIDPLYFGVSHLYEKTWGMMNNKNREGAGHNEGLERRVDHRSLLYIAPRFLVKPLREKRCQVLDLVAQLSSGIRDCMFPCGVNWLRMSSVYLKITFHQPILEFFSKSGSQKMYNTWGNLRVSFLEVETKPFRKDRR